MLHQIYIKVHITCHWPFFCRTKRGCHGLQTDLNDCRRSCVGSGRIFRGVGARGSRDITTNIADIVHDGFVGDQDIVLDS